MKVAAPPSVLFCTEGTYPFVLGGVSTWCDQLLTALGGYDFHLVAVNGPAKGVPVYELGLNVRTVQEIRLWLEPQRRGRHTGAWQARFEAALQMLLYGVEGDLDFFGEGLLALAELGEERDLWHAFDASTSRSWIGASLARVCGRPPTLGEVLRTQVWMRSSLGPLLFIPRRTDLVHVVVNGLAAVVAWVAARTHGVPLILTEHGVYLRERYLAFGDEAELDGVKRFRAAFYASLAKLMYRDADTMVSVSEFNRSWQVHVGADRDRTRVIHNGVDPGLFAGEDPGDMPQPTVGWVGRIDPLKDLDTLIRAFALVHKELPTANLRLFGGVPGGNEAYAAKLHATVNSLGIAHAVRFEGPVRPVASAYRGIDVLALSSVSEGFPYTPIEAMMTGRAVVATEVGGVREAVAEGGLLVPPRAPALFAQALLRLLKDDDLRHGLAARAREKALADFTLEKMCLAYATLYRESIALQRVGLRRPALPAVVSS